MQKSALVVIETGASTLQIKSSSLQVSLISLESMENNFFISLDKGLQWIIVCWFKANKECGQNELVWSAEKTKEVCQKQKLLHSLPSDMEKT